VTDWSKVRAEFPALARWTFLNTATFGQLPRRSTDAVARHFLRRDEFACNDFIQWFDDADGVRDLLARYVCCRSSDIAFIQNASQALSLLMGGIDWKPGDEVVTLDYEFPNHYYYSSYLGRQAVKFIEASYDRFYEVISPATRLVTISTVSYTTGFRAPLEELSSYLRARNILLYIDGTQSLGALRIDLERVRPSMFAVHGYKWMLSPTGAGFMYVAPGVRLWLQPNVIGWRSHHGWRSHENLHHGVPEFKPDAERYEGGMLPFPLLYAMAASVSMMMEIGPERIEQRVHALADQTRDVLRRAGARLLYDEKPHYDSPIIAARFDRADPSALARSLYDRRVVVAARHGYLRVSPHFYNDETDLDRFADALAQALPR
jgi:selenocysteine lyase/cysteine desulfurase